MSGIEMLRGKTLVKIDLEDNIIKFWDDEDNEYHMLHHQDCCEDVFVDDVVGCIDDLLYSPIIEAREASSNPEDAEYFWKNFYSDEEFVMEKMAGFPELPSKGMDESETWTFYILTTNKGSVTIKWYGCSNGYYSERVDFEKV